MGIEDGDCDPDKLCEKNKIATLGRDQNNIRDPSMLYTTTLIVYLP